MKINLNTIAATIAKSDNSSGKDLDIVDVKIVLREFGNLLRESETEEALHILAALTVDRRR